MSMCYTAGVPQGKGSSRLRKESRLDESDLGVVGLPLSFCQLHPLQRVELNASQGMSSDAVAGLPDYFIGVK